MSWVDVARTHGNQMHHAEACGATLTIAAFLLSSPQEATAKVSVGASSLIFLYGGVRSGAVRCDSALY